jgi:hypothetical protein
MDPEVPRRRSLFRLTMFYRPEDEWRTAAEQREADKAEQAADKDGASPGDGKKKPEVKTDKVLIAPTSPVLSNLGDVEKLVLGLIALAIVGVICTALAHRFSAVAEVFGWWSAFVHWWDSLRPGAGA